MEYSKDYPCLYCLSGGTAIVTENGWQGVVKNGSTWHVANRKSGALTYFPEEPVFQHIIVLSKEYFTNSSDLYKLDAQFVEFLREKNLSQYHVVRNGGLEWFLSSCPVSYLSLRLEFLSKLHIPVTAVLESDPFPIRDLTGEEIEKLQVEEKEALEKSSVYSSFHKFCKIFLPGKLPRRIQKELWKKYSKFIEDDTCEPIKGIVQWPTGCGKTIAILMMIVLSKEYAVKNNKIYRGLFVSPKNDILDTISGNFTKLSQFGIDVIDGSNGKLSKITIPANKHCLVMACHAALLSDDKGMRALPPMMHIHYDEVHRITGEKYFELLKEMSGKWSTKFITGTSATPKTASPEQHRKLSEIFGDPISIFHKCDVDEAVQEGWIAKPRFQILILEKNDDRTAVLESYVDGCVQLVLKKGKGRKNIFYIETSIEDVRYALQYAKGKYPAISFYAAIDGERTDDAFIDAKVNESYHILFACQRYREGSDIPGLENTGKLVGNTTAAHNLIQISGRALRIDYPEKEGWCLIARPCESGTSVEDVLDSILLEIIDYLGKVDRDMENKEVTRLVKTYFGEMSISGSRCSLQETIERLQAAYTRIQFSRKTPKERYSLIQGYNKELELTSKYQYEEVKSTHPRYIENPQSYFKDFWISWYHFLGVDTSSFPQTKSDFHRVCKDRNIGSWTDYKEKRGKDLPENPGELYSDWTNPSSEFAIEEIEEW